MTRWDHEADVVVVGAGGAALAAAAAATDAGASVVVLEAGEEPGGTTKRSGGAFWIPNNSLMRAKGLTDPREDALRYMARLARPALYDPEAPRLGLPQLAFDLLAAFYDHGSTAIDELIRLGALAPIILPSLDPSGGAVSDPDYHAELPENKSPIGRVLTAVPAPGQMVWPGVPLIEGMVAHVKGRGVPIHAKHRVARALTNGRGEVTGVEVEHEGKLKGVRAKRGVVFATGGFAHDPAKMSALLRGPVFGSGSAPTSTGAFLDIAARLGAGLGNLTSAFFYQVVLDEAVANQGAIVQPNAHTFFAYGDSTIIVNKYGHRVANEKSPYHVRAQSHFHLRGAEHPNLVQIMIYDEAVAREPTFWPWRGSVPLPGQEPSFVIKGETIEDLAQRIDQRLASLRGARGLSASVGPDARLAPNFVETLRATIQRFNGFAESGRDLDFKRGETPLEPIWQGPSRSTKNRTMHPIAASGPYYAILLGAGTLDTCGGPLIDPSAAVLHQSGAPIPGLYGAGNCVASPAGEAYWGAGGTIGPALTFGFLAGKSAAASGEKPV